MVKDDTRNLSYEKDCKYSMRKYVELPIPMDEKRLQLRVHPWQTRVELGQGVERAQDQCGLTRQLARKESNIRPEAVSPNREGRWAKHGGRARAAMLPLC